MITKDNVPNESDILITTVSKNTNIHGYVVNIKDFARTIQKRHGLTPISTALMCRCLSVTALLSGNLKNPTDLLSCVWNCSGPAKRIVTEVSYEGKMRGFIDNPNLQLIAGSISPESGVDSSFYIGGGELHVARKTFDNRPFYNSVTPLETGEIAQDLAVYLDTSLQVQSALTLGLSIDAKNSIDACGGLLLMAMPGTPKEELEELYEEFTNLGSLTSLLQEDFSKIKELFDSLDLSIADVRKISFDCSCSREKIETILRQLSPEELTSYMVDESGLEASCEYCSETYRFEKEEIISTS